MTIGLLATSFIALGAACTTSEIEKQAREIKNYAANINPAELRERITEKISEQMKSQMPTLKENSFAEFSLQYPAGWSVEHDDNSLTLRDEKTGDYFFISSNGARSSEKMSSEALTTSTIGGREAVRYHDALSEEQGGEFMAVEIGTGKNTLFIRGRGEKFETILNSIKFSN